MASVPWRTYSKWTSQRALKSIYVASISMSATRGRDGIDPFVLESEIGTLSKRLSLRMRAGSHVFTSYRQKLLSKGVGKLPRVISIATAQDRIVLKSISHFLSEVFPESVSRTAQEKIDLLKQAMARGGYDSFVRADIQNFYGAVNHDVLMGNLARRVRKSAPLAVIRAAITTPTSPDGRPSGSAATVGVPQGLAVSNALAEISLRQIDDHFNAKTEIFYLRYVDDVIALCNHQERDQLFDEIENEFDAVHLRVHPLGVNSKSSVGDLSTPFDYLGYLFEDGRVGVRQASLDKVESAIVRVLTRYKHQASQRGKSAQEQLQYVAECAWKLNLVISGCTYRNSRRGWVAYFSQITFLSPLRGLDEMVKRNLKRFSLETRVHPKTFVRTYWAIRHPGADGNYIPNFDKYTTDQKRDLLSSIFGVAGSANFTPTQVEQAFDTRLSKLVKELDRHIGDVS